MMKITFPFPRISISQLGFNRQTGHLRRFVQPAQSSTFLTGENSVYADEMYQLWKENPSSVHPSWDVYFKNADKGVFSFQDPLQKPQFSPQTSATSENVNLVHLVRAFQTSGHEQASIDPLKLMKVPEKKSLDYRSYGFSEADLSREVDLSGYSDLSGYLGRSTKITLQKLLNNLKQAYCGTIGVEYMHIMSREKCNFIRERFELDVPVQDTFSQDEKLQVLDRLWHSVKLEQFLATKWNTAKRFGLEGCEAFVPGFKTLIDRSTQLGGENVFIGMAHRGRLNVLANVIRKDLAVIFKEFEGNSFDPEEFSAKLEASYSLAGDVKYHLGATFDREYPDGRKLHMALIANPSHLEAVNPVVEGRARARQYFDKDYEGKKTLPVLVHGDAAFCGQGVVYETMHLGALDYYQTGGTVHIVVNNQIGFTTNPAHSRSTRYPTDLGKGFDCPIFHVNAHDALGVAYVCKVAAEYRQKFGSDVIVDITGYRQLGHNEMDQPFFTQPQMYSVIRKTKNVLEVTKQKFLESGVVDEKGMKEVQEKVDGIYDQQYEKSKGTIQKEKWLESPKYEEMIMFGETVKPKPTHVEKDVLKTLGKKANTVPEGFNIHPTLAKMLQQRLKALDSEVGVDWGLAEQLAFATLLNENTPVRISGQDCQRGTFAHRHAVLHDQKTFEQWTGLNHLFDGEGNEERPEFIAANSSLSEYAVMGFELGYSLEDPNALVIWEAQFGDFVNGAQIVIDQFLSCQEQKWNRQCGLVLLLPHGYDGQGPDHSSCRIERFLQNSDEDPDNVPEFIGEEARARSVQDSNWQIINCTTPAQIFHALRRQVHRDFRKPLIVASPKAILRTCKSDLKELFEPGMRFRSLLPEVDAEIESNGEEVKRLVFSVGKIYYELEAERTAQKKKDVALVRIEQVMPFPFHLVAEEVKKYPNAEIVFVQEEPKNMGCWHWVDDRIHTALKHFLNQDTRATYVGRGTMSSPAVGYQNVHLVEQKRIIQRAISGEN